jgi:hypothetical protein
MTMLHLGDCRDRVELLDRVRVAAASKASSWVLGVGVRANAWVDPRWPNRRELDDASPHRPCAIMSFDHHAVAANARAMVAAHIADTDADPPGGMICRDHPAAAPNGLLLESAAMKVWHAAPEPTRAETRGHILAAVRHLASLGFVEVHDLLSPAALGPVLAELDDAGELPVSVWLYAPLAEVGEQHAAAQTWQRPRVRFAGAKCFADGTLNSRTAWMLAPYRDPLPGLPRGKALMSSADLAAAMERTHALGIGLAIHAIGDGAVRAVLDAWEATPGRHHVPKGNAVPALRIEHCELVDAADVPRFAELGVVASVQPCHLLADIEVLTRELPHRLDRVLPLRDMIDAGCEPGRGLWFGSDVPIVRADPRDSILAATRRGRPGESVIIAPEQAISEADAWASFEPQGAER